VDCHGGDDQIGDIPEDAHKTESIYRDPELIAQSHVAPKPGLARFFYANGIDDDNDGTVDEAPTFDNLGNVTDFGEIAEFGLHGQGIGEFIDAEFNRDLNYVRWLNPGDLRVATIGCGSSARSALDGSSGGSCHQSVIESNRRSVMVNNSAVINGAYYGNESWRSDFIAARDKGGEAFDPRAGAFGYTLDYKNIDGCIDVSSVGSDDTGRAQPTFDSACLEAKAGQRDSNATAGAPGNVNLPAFEATQGPITGPAPGVAAQATAKHQGASQSRFDWGGHALLDPRASIKELGPVPDGELEPGLPDPVDLMLRGFRAYYPLNYVGSGTNLPFTFGESIVPGIQKFVTNNPFGRGHSSGCTACHMKYNPDGHRNGDDPTTKHREFDPETQDIVEAGGKKIIAGITVNRAERIRAVLGNGADDPAALAERDQQRFYSADHSLSSQITTDQCGLCHAFVTRINFAYQGMAEDEQRDALARRKKIEFTTPKGTQVVIHDSWVREEALTPGDFTQRTVVVFGVGELVSPVGTRGGESGGGEAAVAILAFNLDGIPVCAVDVSISVHVLDHVTVDAVHAPLEVDVHLPR